jgi:hypothetical protein
VEYGFKVNFDKLYSERKEEQYEAFQNIMNLITHKVDWAYEVWDELVDNLTHHNNHERSRATQFLCGLAKSDPEKRILSDFEPIWNVTYDKKFVTARHTLQAIWQVGLAGEEQKEMLLKHLVSRFKNCSDEKNFTLIRFDIIQGLRDLYDEQKEEQIKEIAMGLIDEETDEKYQKKYAKVWKDI